MSPLTFPLPREMPGVRNPSISAFAVRFFDAEVASLRDSASREDISCILNAVLGSSISGPDKTLGVAFNVPQVIKCFIASGPNCSGVGLGKVGTSERMSSTVGDLGLSNCYKNDLNIHEK